MNLKRKGARKLDGAFRRLPWEESETPSLHCRFWFLYIHARSCEGHVNAVARGLVLMCDAGPSRRTRHPNQSLSLDSPSKNTFNFQSAWAKCGRVPAVNWRPAREYAKLAS